MSEVFFRKSMWNYLLYLVSQSPSHNHQNIFTVNPQLFLKTIRSSMMPHIWLVDVVPFSPIGNAVTWICFSFKARFFVYSCIERDDNIGENCVFTVYDASGFTRPFNTIESQFYFDICSWNEASLRLRPLMRRLKSGCDLDAMVCSGTLMGLVNM